MESDIKHVYGLDKVSVTVGGEKLFYHLDRLGSVRMLTGTDSKIKGIVNYDAWGAPTINESVAVNAQVANLLKNYTGHTYDSVLDKYFAQARMYDPHSKHFMAVDPVKGMVIDPMSLVQYAYVLNNPLKYVDPTGMFPDVVGYFKKVMGSGEVDNSQQALRQIFKGYYTDDVTVAGTLGDIGVGFIPVLGQLQSGRNLWHNVTHWEWTPEHIGDTFFNAVGLVPFVGGFKVIGKADDVGKLIKGLDKIDNTAKDSKKLVAAVVAKKSKDKIYIPSKSSKHDNIRNVLRGVRSEYYSVGDKTILLDYSGMKHILMRHHPAYWDGTIKQAQSFFDKDMSVADVKAAIHSVLRQNRDVIIDKSVNSVYSIKGTYNGVKYTVGLNRGRVGQFYPH